MPKLQLPLEKGGVRRVELSWDMFMWKNFTVRFDGQELGRFAGQKELSAGREFIMPDGSVLKIKLERKVMSTELQVLRNGKPLPGSGSDPAQKLKTAYGIVFFIAGFNILLGSVTLGFDVPILKGMGIGIGSLIVGAVFLLLGFIITKKSAVALGLSIALLAADSVLTLVYSAAASGSAPTAGLIVRVFFIIFLFKGFSAIKELKADPGN